jgi:parvulin-like peptidyl-prolyl isomerase
MLRRFVCLFLLLVLAGCTNARSIPTLTSSGGQQASAPSATARPEAASSPTAEPLLSTSDVLLPTEDAPIESPTPAAPPTATIEPSLPVARITHTEGDVEVVTRGMFDQYREKLYPGQGSDNQILDEILSHLMLLREAKRLNITADQAKVDADITQIETQTCANPGFQQQLPPDLQADMQDPTKMLDTCARFFGFRDAEHMRTFIGEGQVTEAVLREKAKGTDDEVKAAHILLAITPRKDEDEAKFTVEAERRKPEIEAIYAEVKANPDKFAEIADAKTEDPSGKGSGGGLGDYFGRGAMVGEFDEAVFAMKPGEISAPVLTQFGWHVIKLIDKRPAIDREAALAYKKKIVDDARAAGKIEVLIELPPTPTPEPTIELPTPEAPAGSGEETATPTQ